MLAMEAESEGPSKIPHPSAQAYWVPERLAPNSRTVDPAPLTRWLPDTLTLKAAVVGEAVVGGGVVVVVVGGGVVVVVVGGGVVVVVVGGGVVVVVVVGMGFGLWDLALACDVVPPFAFARDGTTIASPAELPMINRMTPSHVNAPPRLRKAMSALPLFQPDTHDSRARTGVQALQLLLLDGAGHRFQAIDSQRSSRDSASCS